MYIPNTFSLCGELYPYWRRVARLVGGGITPNGAIFQQWRKEHSYLRDALLPHLGGKDAVALFDEDNGPLGPEWYVDSMSSLFHCFVCLCELYFSFFFV